METASTKPFSEQTICDRIVHWGNTEPDNSAFIFWSPDGRFVLTRGDVLELSSKFAMRLSRRVQPGDVVCISLPNSPERIIAEFGVHLAGCVSMNGQVLRSDGKDLSESLSKANCKAIILDQEQENGAWQVLKQYFNEVKYEQGFLKVQSKSLPSISVIFPVSSNRKSNEFINRLRSEDLYLYKLTKPSDIGVIFSTSGSTGYSKLVMHSHRNILRLGEKFNNILGLSNQDKLYMSSPFGWLGGYPVHYLYSGCTRVLLDAGPIVPSDLAEFVWKILCEEEIHTAVLLPVQIDIVIGYAKKSLKGKKLKSIVTGGQPVKKNLFTDLWRFTDTVKVCYGSTELGYIASVEVTKENVNAFQNFSVGFPWDGIELKVVTDQKAVDKRGEIYSKSDTICMGYVDGKAANEAFMEDGWFRTGDVGYTNDEGCLILEGRSSDAIMHGAYILYPGWLEEKLVDCPGVKQLVIVPVPDPVMHHEICACVIPEEDQEISTEDFLTFSRQQLAMDEISQLNVLPKFVLFFEKFPITGTSKLDRRTLIAEAAKALGLDN